MRFFGSGGENGPPRRAAMIAIALIAIALAFALAPSVAKADSVEVRLVSVTPDGGGNYDWKYSVDLTPGNFVSVNAAGDTIGLFDIDGYVSGSYAWTPVAPVTYATTSDTDAGLDYSFTGTPPGFFAGTSDLASPDLRFTYTGASFANPGPTDILLGFVSFKSIYNTGALDLAWTSDTKTGLSLANGEFQQIVVPLNGGFPVVPLPAPLMAGSALMSLVAYRRQARKA